MNRKEKARKSMQEYMGIESVKTDSVQSTKGELVYYRMQPVNIAVLSQEALAGKIAAMMNVLKSITAIEMCCLDSCENFDDNKLFLQQRIEREDNPMVRELCQKDLEYLDAIQLETATARDFFLILRLRTEKEEQRRHIKSQVEKIIKEQGFTVNRMNKSGLKKMLAVYYAQDVINDSFPDVDGAAYVKEGYE